MFPDEVTGEPAVKKAGGVMPTLTTVPTPETVLHLTPPVSEESATNTCPFEPTGTLTLSVPE